MMPALPTTLKAAALSVAVQLSTSEPEFKKRVKVKSVGSPSTI